MRPAGPLNFYSHTKPCRRRTRIRRGLPSTRTDRLARKRAQLGLLPADADREVGRAIAPALEVAHESLDEPVFERMEADDGEPSARSQHREGGRQCSLERPELVVDGDAQRLEDALRRMAVAEAGRRGDGGLDRLDELARPLERLLLPAAHDRARDLAC